MLNCAFIISDVTQTIAFQFVHILQQNNIFGFSVVFSRRIVQISMFKVEYLKNGVADFNDFGLFCRILNGLSDEINLFWRCISPLTFQTLLKINFVHAELVLFVSCATAVQFPPLSLDIHVNLICFDHIVDYQHINTVQNPQFFPQKNIAFC